MTDRQLDALDGPTLDEIVAKLKAIRQRLPVNDPLHAVAFRAQAICGELQRMIGADDGNANGNRDLDRPAQ